MAPTEYVVDNLYTVELNAHDLMSVCYWAVNCFLLLRYHKAMLRDFLYRVKNKGLAISVKPLTIYYVMRTQGALIFC